jgi:hypothetical protein
MEARFDVLDCHLICFACIEFVGQLSGRTKDKNDKRSNCSNQSPNLGPNLGPESQKDSQRWLDILGIKSTAHTHNESKYPDNLGSLRRLNNRASRHRHGSLSQLLALSFQVRLEFRPRCDFGLAKEELGRELGFEGRDRGESSIGALKTRKVR